MQTRQLERVLAVVERSLRKQFPDDFHKRCVYAALGIHTLLRDAGVAAELTGGDVLAFVVAQDNSRAGMQGFGFGKEQCSHFWVESEGCILDLGPYFIPNGSSYPVARMPAAAWPLSEALPPYLRYWKKQTLPAFSELSDDPVIRDRGARFVALCRKRFAAQHGHLAFPTWLITGDISAAAAARRGDRWAIGARRFADMTHVSSLPF